MTGTLFAGTSGFAYPDWAPRFYRTGSRGDALLPQYAARLNACELNNTYYRQPTEARVAAWARATPEAFRFTVKAQRGGIRALLSDPEPTLAWLLGSLRAFGPRLGSVLYRVPVEIERADAGLDRLLAAWPADLPITFEFQHTSWEADAVHERLARAGAALCATDLDEMPEPTLRLTGRVLYLRLRRAGYAPDELASWAARIVPFLAAGNDVFAFFRHDADGTSALRAIDLAERVAALRAAATAGSVSGAAAG